MSDKISELELNWLSLSLIPKLGTKTIQSLVEAFGNTENILNSTKKELVQIGGVSSRMAQQILQAKKNNIYNAEKNLIEQTSNKIVCLESINYPRQLKEIYLPPPVIYWEGNLSCTESPCVGFVGTRRCTNYGIKHTKRLICELAEIIPEAVIVSGLARGIDTVAHQTALERGMKTVAVLAGGLCHIYPPENKGLAEAIKNQGAIISEFPLGSKPLGRNFPIRNRIISGLSQGIVVCEAGRKSGALLTAGFAIKQNREVFALPGNVDWGSYEGNNRLISQQRAKLIINAQDITEELYLTVNRPQQTEFCLDIQKNKPLNLNKFSEVQGKILEILNQGEQDIDSLHIRTQIDLPQIWEALVELQISGIVLSDASQHYQLDEAYFLEK